MKQSGLAGATPTSTVRVFSAFTRKTAPSNASTPIERVFQAASLPPVSPGPRSRVGQSRALDLLIPSRDLPQLCTLRDERVRESPGGTVLKTGGRKPLQVRILCPPSTHPVGEA